MNKILIFHKRFSYLNHQALLHLLKNVKFVNFSSSLVHQALKIVCEACQMGKSHRLHFPTVEAKATKILELIHTNLWGPSPHQSRHGYLCYISFRKYIWIYPLKLKSIALEVFKLFKLHVENQLYTSIKMLQSDWEENTEHFLLL